MTIAASVNVRKRNISGDRAFNASRHYIRVLGEIYNSAIMLKLTQEWIRDRVRERVTDTSDYRRLPLHYRYYVDGYHEARRGEIERIHLVWIKWVDGKLMTSDEVQALADEEDLEFRVVRGVRYRIGAPDVPVTDYRSPWARVDMAKSRHVWKDDTGNAMKDKPFEAKFR